MVITPDRSTTADDQHRIWQEAVTKALGGRSEQVLTSKTLDALVRGPLMTLGENPKNSGAAGQFPFTRGTSLQCDKLLPWSICCEVLVSDEDQANKFVLEELSGGASAVQLQFSHSDLELKAVLRGVDLNIATVSLTPDSDGGHYAKEFVSLLSQENVDLAKTSGNLGLSPIGFGVAGDVICDLANWAIDNAPDIRSLSVCANLVHEAGGTEALELAWLCAETAENMRILLAAGIKPDAAAKQMQAIISMDADLHLGIAKLRAARRVWAETVTAFGVSHHVAGLQIHARSSLRMFSRYDPWVNILRTSTAALAAVIGGAQEILLVPFTHRLGQPDEMARRLARNTQIVLMEECSAARVLDPAGGSYAHEQMSDQLADKAWQYFQQIEAQGGLTAVIDNGWLHKTIQLMRKTRKQLISRRKISIIGVSQYANLHEDAPKTADCKPSKPPANQAGLDQFYDAEEFEQLRDQAKSVPGKVFLASLGKLSQSAARVGFVRNLLAAGGLETTEARQWEKQTAMLADFSSDVTPIVVVCGTDKQYSEIAEPLAEQFKAKGAKQVWIAGGSGVPEGFTGRMAMGDDVITILQVILQPLGVSK